MVLEFGNLGGDKFPEQPPAGVSCARAASSYSSGRLQRLSFRDNNFEMFVMSIKNALASVAVRDLDRAVPWYERLLGISASRPMPEVAEWKFERGGWLQVYQLAERAGKGSFTLAVTDLDEQAHRLTQYGIDTSQRSAGDRAKTMMITDPDGNHIAFAQAMDTGLAG